MHVIPSIHKNKQIKDLKKSYLYTLKILRLRCFNKDLMLRTETHWVKNIKNHRFSFDFDIFLYFYLFLVIYNSEVLFYNTNNQSNYIFFRYLPTENKNAFIYQYLIYFKFSSNVWLSNKNPVSLIIIPRKLMIIYVSVL